MAPVSEWVIWEAQAGRLCLEDGRTVLVTGGDEILIEQRESGFVVLDHKKAAKH